MRPQLQLQKRGTTKELRLATERERTRKGEIATSSSSVCVCVTRSVLPRLFRPRPVGRSVVRGTLSREQRSCVRASERAWRGPSRRTSQKGRQNGGTSSPTTTTASGATATAATGKSIDCAYRVERARAERRPSERDREERKERERAAYSGRAKGG